MITGSWLAKQSAFPSGCAQARMKSCDKTMNEFWLEKLLTTPGEAEGGWVAGAASLGFTESCRKPRKFGMHFGKGLP